MYSQSCAHILWCHTCGHFLVHCLTETGLEWCNMMVGQADAFVGCTSSLSPDFNIMDNIDKLDRVSQATQTAETDGHLR